MDFILIAVVIIICVTILAAKGLRQPPANAQAEVWINGQTATTINLNKNDNYFFEGANFPFELEVKDNAVKMLKTPCPNQICVHTGAINKNGFSIICVPNRVSIVIKNGAEGFDALSQ